MFLTRVVLVTEFVSRIILYASLSLNNGPPKRDLLGLSTACRYVVCLDIDYDSDILTRKFQFKVVILIIRY